MNLKTNNHLEIAVFAISIIVFIASMLALLLFGINFFFLISICCTITSTILVSYVLIHDTQNERKPDKFLKTRKEKKIHDKFFPKYLKIKSEESLGDDFYNQLLLDSSSILKIWLYSLNLKTEIYKETFNKTIEEIEKYYFNLGVILKQKLSLDIFYEEKIQVSDDLLYRYSLISKNSIILVFISNRKITDSYLIIIKKVVKKLGKNFKKYRITHEKIKEFLDEGIFLYHSRHFYQIGLLNEPKLNKIFDKKSQRDIIFNEIQLSPPGTLQEFLDLYEQLTEQVDREDPNEDFYEVLKEVFK